MASRDATDRHATGLLTISAHLIDLP